MSQQKKYDVFISSKSEDYPIAEKVYDFLVANGLSVFLASRELNHIGEAEYSEAVDAAIDGAHHMIVVTTSLEYLNSKWVRYEWTTFANDLRSNYKEGNLLTILGPKIQLKDLPTALRHKQSFPIKSYKENILDYLYKDKRIDDLETPMPKPTPKPTPKSTPKSSSTHKPFKKSWIWFTIAACAIVGLVIIGVRQVQKRLPLHVERIEALPEGEFQVDDLMYKASEDSSEVTVCGLVNKAATEIYIPSQIDYGHYTYEVTSIGYEAFFWCEGLTSITIPNSVTSIGKRAFAYCSGLTSITIPNSVTSIGDWAFNYCPRLTSITIPNSVMSIGEGAFNSCSGLISIVVEKGNKTYDSRENCNAIIKTATNTLIRGCTNTIIPNSVKSIGKEAFNECSSLTSITIPNSVKSIGKRAFYACSSLTSIVVEKGNIMYDSRENCNAIIETATNTLIRGCNSTIIPNSVTSIGERAFSYCRALTSITIPNSVKSIGKGAFYGCSSLTSITIPNSVKSIGESAFAYCSGLTSITIPNSVTSIGELTFFKCSGLTAITIPNSVTSIGKRAFASCPRLTSIVVEKGHIKYDSRENCNAIIETATNTLIQGCNSTVIHNSVTSIGDFAFDGCSSLTSISIPNSVTSIGKGAFSDCSSLKSIKIPKGLTNIGSNAFPKHTKVIRD